MCSVGRRIVEVLAFSRTIGKNQMSEKLEGIVSPSIDSLLSKPYINSKYELVIFASKRARQINDYYSALQDGHLFQVVGPLVDTTINEKPLTIALKEVDQDKLAKPNA